MTGRTGTAFGSGDVLPGSRSALDPGRAIKPGRPIQDEHSRARIMASLAFVDVVVFFGEQTPLHLIELVQPDILVKGDDYAIDGIVGHELVLNRGGQVLTVPLVSGYSTSRIVAKVRG